MASWITSKIDWNIANRLNYGDLNRIENNNTVIKETLESIGYSPSIVSKTDWSITTIPFNSLTKRIIDNINYLVSVYESIPSGLPEIPPDFNQIDWQDMNAIETFQLDLNSYIIRMKDYFLKCGSFVCGQDQTYL